MDEVAILVRSLLGPIGEHRAVERLTYREAFLRELQIDPIACEMQDLQRAARAIGFTPAGSAERDDLLDLLMGAVVGPKLGQNALTFVYAYPASQAALAQLNPEDPRTALRFELYADGMELANGFHELASSAEQRARFERDQQERQQRRLPVLPMDERLLAALESGLPECAGVAVGFDRLVMLATAARHIDEVLAFPSERA
jgi:elongation factor P--(R)-beta-lysine ligase